MEEKLNLSHEWDKVFPKSDRVEHRKVTFHNRYGITLAADLYAPKGEKGPFAAIAVCGPFGAVKEQCLSSRPLRCPPEKSRRAPPGRRRPTEPEGPPKTSDLAKQPAQAKAAAKENTNFYANGGCAVLAAHPRFIPFFQKRRPFRPAHCASPPVVLY